MKKQLLLTLIGLFSWGQLRAEVHYGECGDSITWSLDTETGVLAFSGKASIEAKKDSDLTNISGWLKHKHYIKTITIGSGITNIGFSAFASCENLDSVFIEDGLEGIESFAFDDCNKLRKINIPNTVSRIEPYAFNGCNKIQYERVDGIGYLSNWALCSYDRRESYTLREGTIGVSKLFSFSHKVESLTLPNTLKYIGEDAFSHSDLMSVVLPDGVVSIGEGAFSGCSKLKSITIPKSVTKIAFPFLANCGELSSIVVEEGNPVYDSRMNSNAIIHTSTNQLIAGCYTTQIPNDVVEIATEAFKGASRLHSIVIPESVTKIMGSAFFECPELNTIAVSKGNTVYTSTENNNAIIDTQRNILVKGCASTIIPNGVSRIGIGAFRGSKITSVNIPGSVKVIEGGAFADCSDLLSVSFEEGLVALETGAFANCTNLESITLPTSLERIGGDAFGACMKLKSVFIPKNVKELEAGCFDNCYALASLTVDEQNPVFDSRNKCNAIIRTQSNRLVQACSSTIIPSDITSIERGALSNSYGRSWSLRNEEDDRIDIDIKYSDTQQDANDIVCYAATPPECDENEFWISYPERKLYVPINAVRVYSQTSPWNKLNVFGFTSEKVNGKMVDVADGVVAPDGVYKQMQYKRGAEPVEDYPFQVYKFLSTEKRIVNNHIHAKYTKAYQMEIYSVNAKRSSGNSVLIPEFLISPSETKVVEKIKNGFVNEWVCNINHRTIKYGTVVHEYYRTDFKPNEAYTEITNLFKVKPKKNNGFLGAWKCETMNGYYKIYGNKYRMSIHLRDNNSAVGHIETVEYLKDRTTIEAENHCNIQWTGADSFTLFYEINGQTFYEKWMRCSMNDIKDHFK